MSCPERHQSLPIPPYLKSCREEVIALSNKWDKALGARRRDLDVPSAQVPYALMQYSFAHYQRPEVKPNVLILTGPNGGGKNYFVAEGLAKFGGQLVVRDTTREIRVDAAGEAIEKDGIDYHFIDRGTYKRLVAEGAYISHTERANSDPNYRVGRGLKKVELDIVLNEGKIAVIPGGPTTLLKMPQAVKFYRPDDTSVISIYLMPSCFTTWFQRLTGRANGDENQQGQIMRRMRDSTAMLEEIVEGKLTADFMIVNDWLNQIPIRAKKLMTALGY